MRLIGLTVILTLGLVLAPLAAKAQPAERVYRIGWLGTYPPQKCRRTSGPAEPVNKNESVPCKASQRSR